MRALPPFLLAAALSLAAGSAQAESPMPDIPAPPLRVVDAQVDAKVVALWSSHAFVEDAVAELTRNEADLAAQVARAEAQLVRAARFACTAEGTPTATCEMDVGPAVRQLQCLDDALAVAANARETGQRTSVSIAEARAGEGAPDVADAQLRKLKVALERSRQVRIEAGSCAPGGDLPGEVSTLIEVHIEE
ncbi:MAG: hypothetical protein H6739_42225 [Alphaproteobacteria bacterium]|nr:hypothetical protein [Alphaproteobacteria bacterium]